MREEKISRLATQPTEGFRHRERLVGCRYSSAKSIATSVRGGTCRRGQRAGSRRKRERLGWGGKAWTTGVRGKGAPRSFALKMRVLNSKTPSQTCPDVPQLCCRISTQETAPSIRRRVGKRHSGVLKTVYFIQHTCHPCRKRRVAHPKGFWTRLAVSRLHVNG